MWFREGRWRMEEADLAVGAAHDDDDDGGGDDDDGDDGDGD